MNTVSTHIVTVNAGSSSIKLALFEPGESPKKILEGVIDNIGQPTASFTKKNGTAQDAIGARVSVVDHVAAVSQAFERDKQYIRPKRCLLRGIDARGC